MPAIFDFLASFIVTAVTKIFPQRVSLYKESFASQALKSGAHLREFSYLGIRFGIWVLWGLGCIGSALRGIIGATVQLLTFLSLSLF